MKSVTIQAFVIGVLLLLVGTFVPAQAQQPVIAQQEGLDMRKVLEAWEKRKGMKSAVESASQELHRARLEMPGNRLDARGKVLEQRLSEKRQMFDQERLQNPTTAAAINRIISRQLVVLVNSHEQRAAARIDVRIADINQAVELSEKQRRKLRVAGKVAIKSYMKVMIAEVSRGASSEDFEFDPNVKIETKGSEKEVAPEISLSLHSIRFMYYKMGSPNLVEDESFWKWAIKTVLTDPQTKKLQQLSEQRSTDRQSAAVRHFIARLDETLRFRPDQKEQLFVVLKENYGQLLADAISSEGSRLLYKRNVMAVKAAINGHVPGFDTSLVDEILTESQALTLKRSLGLELHVLETNKKPKE